MEDSQLKRSQLIVGIALFVFGIALFIGGIALVAVAVLMVLFTDYPAAAAAAIGVPGLVLSTTSGPVLGATLGLVLSGHPRRQ